MTVTLPAPGTAGAAGAGHDPIVTRDLTKVFPGSGRRRPPLRAVDGLDLRVHAGEIFGLLGPNGAGKTTTIGMLTTRVVPSAGQALVAGVDVRRHPAQAKRQIGVVAQSNTLDRSITVAENLFFHGRYFGFTRPEATARTEQLLARFRLTEKADAAVATLSGGMAQRLMVARAVFHSPAVVFLDEPTTGLDPQSRLALWELLRELGAEGQTILLTTHDMDEADELCDRLAIMDAGRLLALGAPAELKRTVDADTVVEVTADGDPAALASALGALPAVARADAAEGSVRLHARSARGLLPQVIATADRCGQSIRDLTVAPPTLETVFITLTGKDLRE